SVAYCDPHSHPTRRSSDLGAGLTLGVVDVSSGPPHTGHFILRDVGYGVGLGAIVGTAVGALFLIDDGRAKDLLTGAAVVDQEQRSEEHTYELQSRENLVCR